jgi:hypothetical protein
MESAIVEKFDEIQKAFQDQQEFILRLQKRVEALNKSIVEEKRKNFKIHRSVTKIEDNRLFD